MNRAEKYININLDQLYEKVSGIKKKHNSFAFSGCAIDPLTGDYFVLSAVNEWLFVLDSRSGLLKYAGRFKEKGFNQPEGICFTPDGDLYVASEGKSEDAILLKYKRN